MSDGYAQYVCSGLWNGTGDSMLSFTGGICLYMLVLSTDKVESLARRYKTLFEQSERLVKISAAVFDKDGSLLEETGLMIASEYSGLYAIDGDGDLKSFAGTGQDGVKIKAANIALEGLVTANGNFKISEDGSIEAVNGKFSGGVAVVSGKLGAASVNIIMKPADTGLPAVFDIAAGRIDPAATSQVSGSDPAVCDDFSRAGGDATPGTAGGALTAAGRSVNIHSDTSEYYGFDQADYGLVINVSGGAKNYGIYSDAALMAPAFISTKANLLTFSGGSCSVDFSQHNIILMYYNDSGYSGTEVTLPDEASVVRQFGLSSLPTDFATAVTFRVRSGSKNITLKGVYNHNEGLTNYGMASGIP